MMTFQTFDAWQSVAGFLLTGVLLFVYPYISHSSKYVSLFFWAIALLAFCAPYLVICSLDEQEYLLLRSGKMLHTLTLVLFFFCFAHREVLRQQMPYFFWFCYALALASLFEFFVIDVLFSQRYYFLDIVRPYLADEWQIVDFNFTSVINYFIKFIFLGLFFRAALQRSRFKKMVTYLTASLVLFELIQVFVLKSYRSYDSWSSTLKNIFILICSGLLLYRIYNNPSVTMSLYRNTYFWICLGFIFPAISELFLEFIFSTLYHTDISQFYSLYLFRNSSQFVGFVLLIVGVWKARYLKFLPTSY